MGWYLFVSDTRTDLSNMKFLVLALCVCAASAASFGANSFGAGGYKPYKAFSPVVAPAQVAAKAAVVATAPVVAPVVVPAAQVTSAAYQGASAAYQGAQQVVTKNVPYTKDAEAVVLRSESDITPTGYNYAYETNNGISGESVATLKQVGDASVLVAQGAYRYVAPDGTPVSFTYVADENGYQPQSDLLPVGPPVPEAIARALAYIAANAKPEKFEKY